MEPIRLGIMGYSAQKFDRQKAIDILFKELSQLPEGSVVVSGETNLGIPGLAYNVAYLLDLTTVGISCAKASGYPCYPCDKVIRFGEDWGDESQTFLEYCDQFLRIGGGAQSIREAEIARQMGKSVIYHELFAS